jgi:ferritin-like metal-binding protein YciE
MIEKAFSPDLRDAFQHHLTETKNHVTRLEQVFQMHGQPAKGTDCPAMDGILSEAADIISDCGDALVCDAAMLSAAQAVEHYEMTRYGTLIAFARQLGRNDCAQVLQQTLEEEKAADQKLTMIADSRVNKMAA